MGELSLRARTRCTNLGLLLDDPKVGGPTALARALGKPDLKAHLSNIRHFKRTMGDHLAADIERATGRPAGWMDQQHTLAGETAPIYALAQNLSDPAGFDGIPLLLWDSIMQTEVPELFRAALPDDALAPDFPAGTEIVWTTRRRATPGRMILVVDRHGQLHARQCHQGRGPGQWLAAPVNAAYVTFDSQEEGVRIVAVFKGRLEPDDD